MSRLLKNMLLLSAAMAAAAGESPYSQRSRGSYFDVQVAREKDFKVHDKDNDRQLRPFKVKGCTIMAYSKKDAIIRWKHQKKGGKQ